MSSIQLLVLRSVFAAIVFLAIMNRRFVDYMWRIIPRRHIGDLISRVIQGLVLMVCIFNSIKYFPLVFVSLISNLTPLLTALLSLLLFKVGLSMLDTCILLLSFVGVTVLITGGNKKTQPDLDQNESLLVPTIMLILIPILSSSVTLFIRHLRAISEITVGSLMTFSILLIYGPLIYITDSYSTKVILESFTINDYVLGILIGITSSIVQITKVKAL